MADIASILRQRALSGEKHHGPQWAEGMRCAANIVEEQLRPRPTTMAEHFRQRMQAPADDAPGAGAQVGQVQWGQYGRKPADQGGGRG